MDKATLVDAQVDDGKKLIQALDAAKVDVQAAMWFYFTESNDWRLVIATPLMDVIGPMKTYEIIQNEMEKSLPDLSVKLRNIFLVNPQHKLIRLMKIAVGTGKTISGIRFTQNVINNILIEDAYIYRMT
jgi:hypothetical protein